MPYETFTAIDFALDEQFRRWVKSPTTETNDFWTSFDTQHPDKRATIREARLLVSRLTVNVEPASPEQLQQLWSRIQNETQPNITDRLADRTRVVPLWRNWARPMRWAAVWVGLLLLAGAVWYQFGYDPTTRYQTAYGETRTVALPDGSVVTLNGHSTLTLRGDWDEQAEREVTLAGEAFFAVRKQKAANGQPVKFRVRTTGLRIDVLGTRFNVNHRRNKTEVVLQEGRVEVSGDDATSNPNTNRSTVMRPGDMLTYSETSHRLTKAIVDPQIIIAWQDKLLLFNSKPVAEITQILADSYGIGVDFRNPDIAAKQFSGSVPTDSVGIFFKKLEKLYGVSVRQTGGRYVIE